MKCFIHFEIASQTEQLKTLWEHLSSHTEAGRRHFPGIDLSARKRRKPRDAKPRGDAGQLATPLLKAICRSAAALFRKKPVLKFFMKALAYLVLAVRIIVESRVGIGKTRR